MDLTNKGFLNWLESIKGKETTPTMVEEAKAYAEWMKKDLEECKTDFDTWLKKTYVGEI